MASAAASARRAPKRAAEDDGLSEEMVITPLGAGNEVGRSCILLQYKGKTIMLDCGVLPSFMGERCLPFIRGIDPASIDIVIIS